MEVSSLALDISNPGSSDANLPPLYCLIPFSILNALVRSPEEYCVVESIRVKMVETGGISSYMESYNRPDSIYKVSSCGSKPVCFLALYQHEQVLTAASTPPPTLDDNGQPGVYALQSTAPSTNDTHTLHQYPNLIRVMCCYGEESPSKSAQYVPHSASWRRLYVMGINTQGLRWDSCDGQWTV